MKIGQVEVVTFYNGKPQQQLGCIAEVIIFKVRECSTNMKGGPTITVLR